VVAYSFQKMFADPILMGGKTQTIRAHRKRHAREGEELQLYTGMRSKQCRLLGRATCVDALPITLRFSDNVIGLWDGSEFAFRGQLDDFARKDGFDNWLRLKAFWRLHHGRIEKFEGMIIFWKDLRT